MVAPKILPRFIVKVTWFTTFNATVIVHISAERRSDSIKGETNTFRSTYGNGWRTPPRDPRRGLRCQPLSDNTCWKTRFVRKTIAITALLSWPTHVTLSILVCLSLSSYKLESRYSANKKNLCINLFYSKCCCDVVYACMSCTHVVSTFYLPSLYQSTFLLHHFQSLFTNFHQIFCLFSIAVTSNIHKFIFAQFEPAVLRYCLLKSPTRKRFKFVCFLHLSCF